ncbi:uncharacterized protein RCO7_14402 [Rhynchosporium graminicola]|uniref:Uncharacterized protein n=1 Tax=Rhynchosporium graminicola TaxID=2792576 RepID=A0A1E1KDN2_9HELO|nr:uncharacterized protein RCO7_14402 [Rhynchosporium commune]
MRTVAIHPNANPLRDTKPLSPISPPFTTTSTPRERRLSSSATQYISKFAGRGHMDPVNISQPGVKVESAPLDTYLICNFQGRLALESEQLWAGGRNSQD